MFAVLGSVLLGLVVGVRHAFEPDHLAAVSTLVTGPGGGRASGREARRGAMVGAIWGLGHTLALLVVGVILLAAGGLVPTRVETGLELAVAVMLIGLGARALVMAAPDGRRGPVAAHTHGRALHRHAAPDGGHVHVGAQTLAWRPLAIGVVHGLAGSGALTALVFAELTSNTARIIYMTLFGIGSVGGMALASGLAGVSLAKLAHLPAVGRRLGAAAGALSIVVGLAWGLPLVV